MSGLCNNYTKTKRVGFLARSETKPNQTAGQEPDCWRVTGTRCWLYRQVFGVENAGEKAYGKATALYNKHWKYSERWHPWHPFPSATYFQSAQMFSPQTKTWINYDLRCGLDNFKIKSCHSADALQTSVKCNYVTESLWECLRVIGPEFQGSQIPELTGPMQWRSGSPGSTWESQRQNWEHQRQALEHLESL